MKKKSLFLLLSAFMMSIILVACGGSDTTDGDNSGAESSAEQVLNLAELSQIPTMDSSLATDAVAFQWLNETMEGLYRLDENGNPVPAIANADPVVSEDGIEWSVTLRDDALWSNGESVTAHDFVFAWRRAIDPETGSEYGPLMLSGYLANAEAIANGEAELETLGVEAVSDYELKITLEKPIPYFHSLLSFGTYLPQNEAFVTEKGDDYALNSDNLLYNGPFVLTEWAPAGDASNQWKLVKNEQYWDKENVKLSEINVSIVADVGTGVNLYNSGDIDRTTLSAEYVSEYISNDDFTTLEEPVIFYMKLNQANEALQNENLRKAIAMAVDKQSYVDVILNNGSTVLNGALPTGFSQHPETGEDFRALNGDFLTYDLEKAQEHFALALEELGTDQIVLQYLGTNTETARETNDYMKNQLETNLEGLEIKVTQVPFEQQIELNAAGDYDIMFSGWGPDYQDPNTFLEMWMSDSSYMTNNINNKEFDALIDEASNVLYDDLNARYQNFLDAEKVLMEEVAIAPLYQRSRALLQRQNIKGVVYNQVGADYSYKYAYIE